MNKQYSYVIKSGRAFNGFEKDRGTIIHIIEGEEPNGFWGGKPLCKCSEPGRRGNGWYKSSKEPSCLKCIAALTAHQEQKQDDAQG